MKNITWSAVLPSSWYQSSQIKCFCFATASLVLFQKVLSRRRDRHRCSISLLDDSRVECDPCIHYRRRSLLYSRQLLALPFSLLNTRAMLIFLHALVGKLIYDAATLGFLLDSFALQCFQASGFIVWARLIFEQRDWRFPMFWVATVTWRFCTSGLGQSLFVFLKGNHP